MAIFECAGLLLIGGCGMGITMYIYVIEINNGIFTNCQWSYPITQYSHYKMYLLF